MAEVLDEATALESTTVGVFRTAATIKGGRRFSFSALVVVGDRRGRVGVGYGKANQVPPAIEKAQKDAKRRMSEFPLVGRTLPHGVTGRYESCEVRMMPASPGTGVIAGAAVRAPLEMLGVQDCLTKSYGSNNPKNLVKAVINGLEQLRSKGAVETLRGVTIGVTPVEEAIERGRAFMPETPVAPAAPKPQPPEGGKGGGRGGRGGGGRGRGGGGGGRGGGGGGPRAGARTDARPEARPEARTEKESKPKSEGPAADDAAPKGDAGS